jgi:hypothetical protein
MMTTMGRKLCLFLVAIFVNHGDVGLVMLIVASFLSDHGNVAIAIN